MQEPLNARHCGRALVSRVKYGPHFRVRVPDSVHRPPPAPSEVIKDLLSQPTVAVTVGKQVEPDVQVH